MCGIAGILSGAGGHTRRATLLAMAGELRHRGPDGTGTYVDGPLAMANTRLAIVDLEGGDQPLSAGGGRYWAMQNGEIYNHVELRAELQRRGCRFTTTSDTEVVAHAYATWGAGCLHRFNGDFAIAVWDRVERELFLARDRFGVRPLFLAEHAGELCFASEAKALLRHPRARRALDPSALVDVFTTWGGLPDRAAFAGVRELPAGHYVRLRAGAGAEPVRWWDVVFDPRPGDEDDLADELCALLTDAVRLRLRADVDVAAYLSGGLDSSALAAIAAREADGLHAFGVGFEDARFDESAEQDAIARELRMAFHRTTVGAAEIAAALPRVVELGERPLLRTAPAPLLRLSARVRDAGLKVVLTGEGADELFAGYDLFREDKVRRFWARYPESALRPQLLGRLNRFLTTDPARAAAFARSFYARGLTDTGDPLYSHRLRFTNTGRLTGLLDREVLVAAAPTEPRLLEQLPARFGSFSPLGRAQYLEIATFLHGYLLHAQGDRMLMGSSVEGRFPYLDHRVAEFAARLPDSMRLRGLQEKHLLRRAVASHLPQAIRARPKVPYRAPIRDVFFGAHRPEYLAELLRPGPVADAGVLNPAAVGRVVAKFERGGPVSETDEMALVGAVSTMLLHDRFVAGPVLAAPAAPTREVVGDRVLGAALAEAA